MDKADSKNQLFRPYKGATILWCKNDSVHVQVYKVDKNKAKNTPLKSTLMLSSHNIYKILEVNLVLRIISSN